MIKRTLFFSNPAYLSTKNEQIIISYPDKNQDSKTVAIEDIGFIVLENQQITITNGLLEKLVNNNVALINCDQHHLPIGLLMPLNGHTEQSERFKNQINASIPLKKNLWQQTISAKIANQGKLLRENGIAMRKMEIWVKELPTLGIFHRNKYNAYCLADDIMEPYRPFVDKIVCEILKKEIVVDELTTEIKKQLLNIVAIDVIIDGKKSPLMVAMSRTTNSLNECFEGSARKILYPEYV